MVGDGGPWQGMTGRGAAWRGCIMLLILTIIQFVNTEGGEGYRWIWWFLEQVLGWEGRAGGFVVVGARVCRSFGKEGGTSFLPRHTNRLGLHSALIEFDYLLLRTSERTNASRRHGLVRPRRVRDLGRQRDALAVKSGGG